MMGLVDEDPVSFLKLKIDHVGVDRCLNCSGSLNLENLEALLLRP